MAEEGLTKTDNDLIHIGKPIPFDTDVFLHQLENLAVVAYGNDPDVRSYVEEIVPTYHAAKDDLKLHLISLGVYSFRGVKVALDCANGSSWNIANALFNFRL